MDPVTSIAALIYASTDYATHLWDMLRQTTPELATGEAEFFFVANDATDDVLAHLHAEKIPHVVQRNGRLTEAELAERGFDPPEYLRRVYQGWNRAVREATADCLVLLNSDHVMRHGWLSALRGQWSPEVALSPRVIEPGGSHGIFSDRVGRGTGAIRGDWGRGLAEFNAAGFEAHADQIQHDATTPGGVYMPVMVSRDAVMKAGLYPEGNPRGTYGDRYLFRQLEALGVTHRTYHGVVAYHFQEGEMREAAA